jgi:lysyl-tRNA synthetase class 2
MTDTTQPPIDENKLIAERRQKLAQVRDKRVAFPNDFRRDALAEQLHIGYDERASEWFDTNVVRVKVAGRVMAKRGQGKVSFVNLQDRSGVIQLFIQANAVGDIYDEFKTWDIGDVVGAEGPLFKS